MGGEIRADYLNTIINEYGFIPKDIYATLKKPLVEKVKHLINKSKNNLEAIFSDKLIDPEDYRTELLREYGLYLDVLEMNDHDKNFIKNGRSTLESIREKQNKIYEKKEQKYKKAA